MTTTLVSCKRPKVTTEAVADLDLHLTRCGVPGCTWTYGPGLKTDVEQQARWHRRDHRAGVPRTHIFKPTADRPGYSASCYECMWDTPAGVITRTDVQASLNSHCSSVHGLVSC